MHRRTSSVTTTVTRPSCFLALTLGSSTPMRRTPATDGGRCPTSEPTTSSRPPHGGRRVANQHFWSCHASWRPDGGSWRPRPLHPPVGPLRPRHRLVPRGCHLLAGRSAGPAAPWRGSVGVGPGQPSGRGRRGVTGQLWVALSESVRPSSLARLVRDRGGERCRPAQPASGCAGAMGRWVTDARRGDRGAARRHWEHFVADRGFHGSGNSAAMIASNSARSNSALPTSTARVCDAIRSSATASSALAGRSAATSPRRVERPCP